jgi:NADH-quinone oxidoreductase subunit C
MGKPEEIITDLKNKFSGDILDDAIKSNMRVSIQVSADALPEISKYFYRDLHFRFIIASALESKTGFEIYYHFSDDKTGCVINLHVILPREKPEIESLTSIFESANWIEREMHELLGINFLNHPNLEKLISDGNWAEGVYPLRKEQKS